MGAQGDVRSEDGDADFRNGPPGGVTIAGAWWPDACDLVGKLKLRFRVACHRMLAIGCSIKRPPLATRVASNADGMAFDSHAALPLHAWIQSLNF